MEAYVLEKRFPVKAEDYKLYEEVGEGVSATVYRALCVPLNQIVAIKVLDLERCNNDLDGIRREVQTMTLIDHPNVLRAHCSFTTGHNLWVVMPYMAGGSCLHIMKSAYPEGFEEPVIATLLRETLRALVYLHSHGHIHRDVKAGNILIDSNGAVKLADFGVSAGMFDTGDRQRSRNTFVGTPCWMAPEVMQQLHGYDFKADIWSFGITALELAHGHAPFSKYPPMKVLLMTLQNAPPGLDYERDKRFSKSFKELVAACLVKDPKKRPTSEKLLKHHFFKHARSNDFLACTILDGLPPLGERFRVLKVKEADLLVQNKALYENKDHLSQQEYIKGISAWNFNLDDLKAQAALIQDNDVVSNVENPDVKRRLMENQDKDGSLVQDVSHAKSDNALSAPNQDGMDELIALQSSLASFPVKPLQALKGCFDMGENEEDAGTLNLRPASEQPFTTKPSEEPCQNRANIEGENLGKSSSLPHQLISENKKFLSGSLLPDVSFSPRKVAGDGDRELLQPRCKAERSYSGPLLHRQKRESNSLPPDDATEGAVVTRRGRFQVTSTDLSPKVCTNSMPNQVTVGSTSLTSANPAADAVLPSLQLILQQNIIQREEIIRLIRHFELLSGKPAESTEAATSDLPLAFPATTRERELQYLVTKLQQSIVSIVEELQRQKEKNAQLEKQLSALANKECNEKETFWR